MTYTAPKKPTTLAAAAAQARQYPHGSGLHSDAMTVLFTAYRAAHPESDGTFITLDALWAFVNEALKEQPCTNDTL